MSDPNLLTDLLSLSCVPRWAIVPHLRSQMVSDHTFRTMAIAYTLSSRLCVDLTADDFVHILSHDLDECRSGDLPTPFKEQLELEDTIYRATSSKDASTIIQLADWIEAYTFITMWGKGAHASRVSTRISEKIFSAVPDSEWWRTVNQLIGEILNEDGR